MIRKTATQLVCKVSKTEEERRYRLKDGVRIGGEGWSKITFQPSKEEIKQVMMENAHLKLARSLGDVIWKNLSYEKLQAINAIIMETGQAQLTVTPVTTGTIKDGMTITGQTELNGLILKVPTP